MTYVCAICGFEINIGGNRWSPPVYNEVKDEHYHYTCWYFQKEGGIK
jgi:hypothetical protein